MALSFPLALTSVAYANQDGDFDLDPSEITAPTWGGLVQSVNQGRRLWRMSYVTRPLREEEAFGLLADLRALKGSVRPFKALDPLRRFAIAYPGGYTGMTKAGGGAFNGTAKLDAVAETLDAVTLDNLPAGFVLKKGDLLSFAFGSTRQALHSVVEAGTANGSGVATVGVEPSVVPGFTLDADVALADPWCKARLTAKPTQRRMANRKFVVSFAAIQDIRP